MIFAPYAIIPTRPFPMAKWTKRILLTPGILIARFDGEHWDDMGGGLAYTPNPYAGAALDLEWWRGELLVSGFFNDVAGLSCSSIAKWNGQQWCTFPGVIRWQFNSQPNLTDMAIWRDSLYICGGINTIDSDTVRKVAQWIVSLSINSPRLRIN